MESVWLSDKHFVHINLPDIHMHSYTKVSTPAAIFLITLLNHAIIPP